MDDAATLADDFALTHKLAGKTNPKPNSSGKQDKPSLPVPIQEGINPTQVLKIRIKAAIPIQMLILVQRPLSLLPVTIAKRKGTLCQSAGHSKVKTV